MVFSLASDGTRAVPRSAPFPMPPPSLWRRFYLSVASIVKYDKWSRRAEARRNPAGAAVQSPRVGLVPRPLPSPGTRFLGVSVAPPHPATGLPLSLCRRWGLPDRTKRMAWEGTNGQSPHRPGGGSSLKHSPRP